MKCKSTVSGVGIGGVPDFVADFEKRFKPDGVVDEGRIEEGEEKGFESRGMDGSDDGDVGEEDRLRAENFRAFDGFKNDGDVDGEVFSFFSFDSTGFSLRVGRVNEDISRLAAANGPAARQSVIEPVRVSFELDTSSFAPASSLFDMLNKYIDIKANRMQIDVSTRKKAQNKGKYA